ncbi:hypothetical protein ACH50O_01510 [Methylomonas sp. 2BW1-5-20]|uniref:hypothetical protein n=1 Tax=Methylomonas sp. 2BW1-5-20 TaxID=3376686 RepID=UPI0040508CFB
MAKLKTLIQLNKLETAHHLRAKIRQIFAYAIVYNYTGCEPASLRRRRRPPFQKAQKSRCAAAFR